MRTIDVLIAEIGSTTTVVNAVDNLYVDPVFLGQGLAPTTVSDGDVTKGLKNAIKNLESNLGQAVSWNNMLATSSAAGGLKMTVHGLAYDMTVKAAKEAALGAGAILHLVTAGKLTHDDIRRIEQISPNIILLAGGVDHGDKNTAIENAYRLSKIKIQCPLIYAGNVAAAEEVSRILSKGNVMVTVVDNVYPRIDELNVEPTRRAIQKVFEDHIIRAPGMNRIKQMVTGNITPTPGAVMNCAKLLKATIGDLLVIDVGGATTDVHSVTTGSEKMNKLLISPEPEAKRTVEGDLGIYINASNLIKAIGAERVANELSLNPDSFADYISPIPRTSTEMEMAEYLTKKAAEIGIDRHAGEIKHLYGPGGRATIVMGKDLTNVKWIIGTGGAFVNLKKGRTILSSLTSKAKPLKLLPRTNPRFLIDKNYIMASVGVLALTNPEGALRLVAKSLDLQLDTL
jgi:uncharacterized protein (TIGR01319 family)